MTGEEEITQRVAVLIDLRAIRENIAEEKKIIAPGTGICAVVKADAYGHGAVPVAKALSKDGIAMFAVAIPEEGAELRKAGIQEPILLLGYTAPQQYEMLFDYDLTPTLFQYERARELNEMAAKRKTRKKIHIKLDTGMGRIGYADTEESAEEIRRIHALPNLEIEGVFTHFARADETDKEPARRQLTRYLNFIGMLKDRGIQVPIRHASNSAGIIDLPEANLDMVRSGIATYGLYPSEEVDQSRLPLRPAMEFKTHISYVKTLPPGCQISYGGIYETVRETRIATIPVGYADGYPRSLSNRGSVLIHGKYAPIRGRICMDQFMVDVTQIPEAKQGDTVTLFGWDHGQFLSVEKVAELAGSFHYEFVCGIARRVPRIYLA